MVNVIVTSVGLERLQVLSNMPARDWEPAVQFAEPVEQEACAAKEHTGTSERAKEGPRRKHSKRRKSREVRRREDGESGIPADAISIDLGDGGDEDVSREAVRGGRDEGEEESRKKTERLAKGHSDKVRGDSRKSAKQARARGERERERDRMAPKVREKGISKRGGTAEGGERRKRERTKGCKDGERSDRKDRKSKKKKDRHRCDVGSRVFVQL